jgi:hypothetical protein
MNNEKTTAKNTSENFYLSDSECRFLYKAAGKVLHNEVIIEIGDYYDNATLWLASGAHEGNQCKLYNMQSRFDLIDQTEEAHTERNEIINIDTENNAIAGYIDFSYSDSDETVRRWKYKIALICLNVFHRYDDMHEILNGWERHLAPKAGVIIFNCSTLESSQILKDKPGNTGTFVIEQRAGSLALIRLDKCIHHWMLDSSDYGICRYCNRTRNFRKMLKESRSYETRRRTLSNKQSLIK